MDDSYIQTGSGSKFSFQDGVTLDDDSLRTIIDRTFTARLGMEYTFIAIQPDTEMKSIWSIRTGLFFDEEPSVGRSSIFEKGDGDPDSFYGTTIGAGLLASNRFNFDFAYQFRYGDNVNSDIFTGARGFTEDVPQHRFLISSVIYFQAWGQISRPNPKVLGFTAQSSLCWRPNVNLRVP